MRNESTLKGIPIRVEQSARGPASGDVGPSGVVAQAAQAAYAARAAKAGTAAKAAATTDAPIEVELFEKHKKIYPRQVTGLFARWRVALVVLTQLVFYGLPWLTWNGRQAVLFDIAARKFYVFGLVMWPQDFIFLTALLVMSALSLFLFTAVAGRLWCGYACPQTVYTEIFMWIERKFEGDRARRMKLDAAPWSVEKLWRKGGKQAAWIALSLWTGFTFVGYFTPIHVLSAEVAAVALGPWEGFWVAFYGLATYGNAGFLREQVCKYMCPYARFQSAMFDKDTLIISYDAARGEPRGSRSKKADPAALGLGSCVDCTLCVQVCPTGIDIRNGLQYECIGCAACIDVCDDVMGKMGYAPGLIRYSTQRALEERDDTLDLVRHALRPRTLIYGSVLVAIAAAFVAGLAMRDPIKVDVMRDRNSLSRMVEDRIENVYRLQLMNATESPARYVIEVEGLPEIRVASEPQVDIAAAESRTLAVRVQVPSGAAAPGSKKIEFVVRDPQHGTAVREKSVFIMPR